MERDELLMQVENSKERKHRHTLMAAALKMAER